MKEVKITVVDLSNRAAMEENEFTAEGSTYEIASRRAFALAEDAAGSGAYISRWVESHRVVAANDDSWKFHGEYCK